MIEEVTNPEILDQLNSGSTSSKPKQSNFTEVTDLGLLSELENNDEKPASNSMLSNIAGVGKQLGAGVIQGLAQAGHAVGSLETQLINSLLGSRLKSPKPDVYSPLGVKEGVATSIGEFLPALAIPEANLGRAGELISQIPKGGRYLQKALSQAYRSRFMLALSSQTKG